MSSNGVERYGRSYFRVHDGDMSIGSKDTLRQAEGGSGRERGRPFMVCRDGQPIPEELRGAVVAIGNFDGLHRGHRALIDAAIAEAAKRGTTAAALTFEPHPRQVFQPEKPFFRLTPETVKLAILDRMRLDGVFLRRFDPAFAAQTAEDFVAWLFDELQVSAVVVGYDFHFGQERRGTPDFLRNRCAERNVGLIVVSPVEWNGGVVSSSAIRTALMAGDIAKANDLLGYRWFVRSEVQHGEKRGRVLGFPTANLKIPDDCPLRHGVYAIRARAGSDVYDGVASYGRRPTFDNGAALLEGFLFDFSGDLYGRTLDVELVSFIREEKRFADIEALKAEMLEDCNIAKKALTEDRVPSMLP